MIRLGLVLLFLSAAAARAEFALSDLVGNWAGTGMYSENLSKARLRCQISVAGDDAKITLSGRCASSLGAQRVVLDFIRQRDGQIVVQAGPGAPSTDSPIEGLAGRPTATELTVLGEAGSDRVVMQFRKNGDGTIVFATDRKWVTGRSQSSVVLTPR